MLCRERPSQGEFRVPGQGGSRTIRLVVGFSPLSLTLTNPSTLADISFSGTILIVILAAERSPFSVDDARQVLVLTVQRHDNPFTAAAVSIVCIFRHSFTGGLLRVPSGNRRSLRQVVRPHNPYYKQVREERTKGDLKDTIHNPPTFLL